MPDDGPPVEHPVAWWQPVLLIAFAGLVIGLGSAALVAVFEWLLL